MPPVLSEIKANGDLLPKPALWIIGGDGWSVPVQHIHAAERGTADSGNRLAPWHATYASCLRAT